MVTFIMDQWKLAENLVNLHLGPVERHFIVWAKKPGLLLHEEPDTCMPLHSIQNGYQSIVFVNEAMDVIIRMILCLR